MAFHNAQKAQCMCCAQPLTLSRRGLMIGAGAAALTSAMQGSAKAQDSASAKPFRIDVHHHLSPPTYVAAAVESGVADPLMKKWTIDQSLADMDESGIAASILSVTTPGLNFTKERRGSISPRTTPRVGLRANRTNRPRSSSTMIPAASGVSRCSR